MFVQIYFTFLFALYYIKSQVKIQLNQAIKYNADIV